MLPINRLDKFLFICLYNFANSFKLYIYILAIYITINIYFGINDGQIAIAFVLCFMMLILLALLTMLVIGIILAVGKFDYEKDKNLK